MIRCLIVLGPLVVFGPMALAILGCGDGATIAPPPPTSSGSSDKIPIRKDRVTVDFKRFVSAGIAGSEGRAAWIIFGSGYDKSIADIKVQLVYKDDEGKRLGSIDWSPAPASEWLASGQQTEEMLGTDLPREAVSVDVRVLEITFADGTNADLDL